MHERKPDLLWQTRIITEVYFFCSLIAYSAADWVGCPDTRWSTSGYWVYLGDNLCPSPQMPGYSLSLQWRSQLSCRGSRCGWMFLALSTSAWASSPPPHRHSRLLWKCQRYLHGLQPGSASWKGVSRSDSGSSCAIFASVSWYYDKESTVQLFMDFPYILCVRPSDALTAGGC